MGRSVESRNSVDGATPCRLRGVVVIGVVRDHPKEAHDMRRSGLSIGDEGCGAAWAWMCVAAAFRQHFNKPVDPAVGGG